MEEVTHPRPQGQEVAGLGLRPVLPSEPWKAAPSGGGIGPGRGGAYLRAAATVYIGAHGVVGSGATHVQVCSVPGLDEPDEVPALTLGPEGKPRRCPRCLPGPMPSWGPRAPCPPHPSLPVDPTALTLPSLPESTHSSMRCGVAAQWICQRGGSEGLPAGALHPGAHVPQHPPPHIWPGPYNEGLAVDVMQVQGQHVVLAAHIHAVVVLVLEQDSVVACVEKEVEEVGGACGLKLCGRRVGQQWAPGGQPASPRQRR